jgi:hypothetical protein
MTVPDIMRVQNRESGAEVKGLYSGRYKRKERERERGEGEGKGGSPFEM